VLAGRPGDSLRLVFPSTIGSMERHPGNRSPRTRQPTRGNPTRSRSSSLSRPSPAKPARGTLGAVTLRICYVAGGGRNSWRHQRRPPHRPSVCGRFRPHPQAGRLWRGWRGAGLHSRRQRRTCPGGRDRLMRTRKASCPKHRRDCRQRG
jgi:hypothetical protein